MISAPRVLAHRGASGQAWENSIEAYRAAREAGADGVELDVHTTRDGALLIHHDPEVPGIGPIHAATLHHLRQARLPNGEAIPILAEALDELAGLEVWIELKGVPPENDATLLETISRSPSPDRCAIHSFDHRIIARLGGKQPALRRGVLSASYPVDPAAAMTAAGATVLWQEWHLIDAELVAAIHRAGGEVVAWTVNDGGSARALAAFGVDALCGNYPERLKIR